MSVRTLGPGSLSIGPTATPQEWGGDITKATLTPSTDSGDADIFLDGTEEAGEETTTWELGGTIGENYELESLQSWALDHAGEEHPFAWTPNDTGEITISGMVKIRPIGWGGDVKAKNKQDFTFPLVGQPTHAAKV